MVLLDKLLLYHDGRGRHFFGKDPVCRVNEERRDPQPE